MALRLDSRPKWIDSYFKNKIAEGSGNGRIGSKVGDPQGSKLRAISCCEAHIKTSCSRTYDAQIKKQRV